MSKKYWYKKKKVERAYKQGCEIQYKLRYLQSKNSWKVDIAPQFNWKLYKYRAAKPKFKTGEVYKNSKGEDLLILVMRKEKVQYPLIAVNTETEQDIRTFLENGQFNRYKKGTDDLIWEPR